MMLLKSSTGLCFPEYETEWIGLKLTVCFKADLKTKVRPYKQAHRKSSESSAWK